MARHKASCPACGAELSFQSAVSVYAVCSYCQSTVVRHDTNLEAVGKMAILLEDLSPLQIGTKGQYQGKRFELIGRVRRKWEQGFWNEWAADWDNGKECWLAEAQGFYAFNRRIDPVGDLPKSPDTLEVGQEFTLTKDFLVVHNRFKINDIKRSVCVGSEGELPFAAEMGRELVSADLVGPNEQFASIEYLSLDGSAPSVYVGEYLEFDDFEFENLREIDGWLDA